MKKKLILKRALLEVFGGCNYTCQMCPQSSPGRDKDFRRKLPLDLFKKILDKIVPEYGQPVIGLSGSGEPTMAKDLARYIEIVKKKNLKCFIYTNGERLSGQFMRDVVNAGIDLIRFSIIGYNKETYFKWMNSKNFEVVIENFLQLKDYVNLNKLSCVLGSYHLITNNLKLHEELLKYKDLVGSLNSVGYVWKMHNMSGNIDNSLNPRVGKKKTCGRPFAPELTVRAGGIDGKFAAVTACCQTLGPPNESKSVMGHLDTQSVEEIYFGKDFEELRLAHENEEFDKIEYCKNCDFLIEDPEVLVWTNDLDYKVGNMVGVEKKFNIFEYNRENMLN